MKLVKRMLWALLPVVLLAGAARGDRPAAPARVSAPRAAAPSPAGPGAAPMPRFTLFGWVSPPSAFESAERYREMAGAGFNVTVLAWEDSGLASANRRRLDWTRPVGMRNLLLDSQLDHYHAALPETHRWADSVTARYRTDPAFLGYYLGDEPAPADFERLREWFDALRARDPLHPGWNNLFGRMVFSSREQFEQYVRDYVAAVDPAVLCADQYDFLSGGDRHQLVENVAALAAIARENGLPFWGIVQLVQHRGYRPVTEGLLRWQVAQWLSYGARGIGYFTYWTPAPDTTWDWQPAMIAWGTGARTPAYEWVRALNVHASAVGVELAGMQWLSTEHAGSVAPGGTPFAPDSLLAAVEGRATIGTFADSLGRAHLLVGNADSLAARDVALTLAGAGRRAWRLRDDGGWDELAVSAAGRCAISFAPGDFALLRLSGALGSVVAGRSPLRLEAFPNPARGAVRLTFGGMAPGARLELLDASGRRVWARDYPAGGSAAATWNGERAGGGRAPAGLYFARLEDSRGVVARRVAWLGGR